MKIENSPTSSESTDWTSPEYAEENGGGLASYLTTSGGTLNAYKRHWDFGFSIPSNATINGIEVKSDLKDVLGCSRDNWRAKLSWNGGTTYTSEKAIVNAITSTETTKTLGSPTDTWGRSWTAAELNAGTFKVQNGLLSASQCVSDTTFYDDWTRIKIYYTASSTPTQQTFFFAVWNNPSQDNFSMLALFGIMFFGVLYLIKKAKKK